MRIRNYLGTIICAIVIWVIGMIAVYGIIYVAWGRQALAPASLIAALERF
jgi:hypothetical protein